MNITLDATTPATRIVMCTVIIGLAIDPMDIKWVSEPVGEPMTHERAMEVCDPAPIHKLGAWEVECGDVTE